MEKTLYTLNFISECNFGVLQKIKWMRASRTDKKVSAVFNVVSCKLHKSPEMDVEEMKKVINSALPQDIKIFKVIEVSNTFDSKSDNNNREYHYILPSFMLQPKNSESTQTASSTDNSIGDYTFKITPEFLEKVANICKVFKGTKKYHNYTKKLFFSDASCSRHIYEFSCELLEYENFQAVKFKIIGQSFLYNQIRKMVGCIIDVCRENRDNEYLDNSFLSNKVDIPKAPAEGLYLRKIDYSRYNDRKSTKKSPIFTTETDEKEMEDFAKELVNRIHDSEVKDKVFSKWLWRLENNRENTY
jgi:tRNA pseudouridine38-40 synthase